jgi:hypothetical protein
MDLEADVAEPRANIRRQSRIRVVLQKITWDTKILNVTSVQAATSKRSATNLTCPRMSPCVAI